MLSPHHNLKKQKSVSSIGGRDCKSSHSLDLIVGDLSATKKWLLNGNAEHYDRGDPMNSKCFECKRVGAEWVSVNNGIYICLNCAGIHRSFGVQVSFVRSLQMDNITDLQKRQLLYGGNRQFLEFLKLYRLEHEPINTRYFTKACQLYRDKLKQMAELNEVFIFNKDLHQMLPLNEGKISIYGVHPNNIFEVDKDRSNQLIFSRDTASSGQRAGDTNLGSTHAAGSSYDPNYTGGNLRSSDAGSHGNQEEWLARRAQTFIETTKENFSLIGQKLGMFQSYVSQQFSLANCCNNFRFNEEQLTTKLEDLPRDEQALKMSNR